MKNSLRAAAIAAFSFSVLASSTTAMADNATPSKTPHTAIKNIVLVHGAWVDGSGWAPVYSILTKDGYHVSIVQEPLTSLSDDVAATRRVLDMQDGPAILVGHSYGGSVITQAGVHPNVAGLVYVAAHAPNVGEDESALGKQTPSITSKQTDAIEKTNDGYTFLNPADFPKDFAADLPRAQSTFEAHAQMLTAAQVSRRRSPRRHGRPSPVGASWRARTRSSTLTLNAGTTLARTATRRSSPARVIPSTSRGRSRSPQSSRMQPSMRSSSSR